MVAAGLLALSFFTLALGAPTPDVFKVHDARAVAPAGYTASGAAEQDTMLSLSIALKSDTSALQKTLLDVSTPGSANYRKFLTKAQVRVFPAHSCERTDAPTHLSFSCTGVVSMPCGRARTLGGEAHGAERGRPRGDLLLACAEQRDCDSGRDEPVVEHPGPRLDGEHAPRCRIHDLHRLRHRRVRCPHARLLRPEERPTIR